MPLVACVADGVSDEQGKPCSPPRADEAPINIPFADDTLDLRPGPSVHVLHVPGQYVNDHTWVQGPDKRWHIYGIYGVQPRPEGQEERDFVHAVATVQDPADWSTATFSLPPAPEHIPISARADLDETHVWAPHVVKVGDAFQMFFHAGGTGGTARMKSARSFDLFAWERQPAEALFSDVCVARDPMVVRIDERWVMYYTRCNDECEQRSGVAVRTSTDGLRWSEPEMALTLGWSKPMGNSGFTESPFVFHRGEFWYLSVTAYPVDWAATLLFRSRDPFHFDERPIARVVAHAAEWLARNGDLENEPLFLSHAGPGQEGVWVMPVSGL